MKIKFTRFPEEFKLLKPKLFKKFNEIGQRGEYVFGKELDKFEKNIQKKLNVKHALGVGNWTEGTMMVFKALNFKKKDEIITVSNSFIATCGAISYLDLKPIFVDIGDDLNMDPNLIESKISKKTKAIMPVHLAGIPSNLTKIKRICKNKKLILIEDAAHAFATKYNNRYLGTIGDVGIFSLHPRKSFHVLGDGGIIVTNNTKLYKKLKLIRNHGLKNRNESTIWGTNSRLDNIQAGFGNIMLEKINSWNKIQLNIAKKYTKELKNYVKTPIYDWKTSNPTFHQYIIKTKHRDRLKNYLLKNKIETAIHYPIPIHLQSAYKNQYRKISLPKTEFYSSKILSLPIHPLMKKKEVNYVIKKIVDYFS